MQLEETVRPKSVARISHRLQGGNLFPSFRTARQPNSGLPEFGDIIVQVGYSRLGRADPESRGYFARVFSSRFSDGQLHIVVRCFRIAPE